MIFLIISKRYLFVIKRLVITQMFCDRRHAWLQIQSRLTALLFNCTIVGLASDCMAVPFKTLLKSSTGGW